MHMGLPQIIVLALTAFSIGISVARFGQGKQERYDIVDVLIAPAISIGLLYWGGFFS